MTYWQEALGIPAQPPTAPAVPRADGAAYREMRAQQSGSLIYRMPVLSEQAAGAKPKSIYDGGVQYAGLQVYQSRQAPTWADRKAGESLTAWKKRLGAFCGHEGNGLPAEVLEELSKPDEQISGEEHRARVDAQGLGITGLSPHQRVQAVEARFGTRSGSRQIAQQGELAADTSATIARTRMISGAQAYGTPRANAEQQRQQPQRPTIPDGSSGQGWVGVDNA
jgi:hypothetical protein